ncbi:MAG: nucleotide disphospho-sugar-binding domain-containing protein [Actinomycetales bacterium]
MTETRRFMVASWDGGGNTPPAINLGARLVESGHDVCLLGWETMRARCHTAGLDFRGYRSMKPWPDGLSQDDGWELLVEFLHGPATRDDIVREARDFAADVLVLDCMMRSAYEAAGELGRPSAVLTHVLYAPFAFEWGAAVMNTDPVALLAGTDCVLALTPAGFDQECVLPANTSYVGPISRRQAIRRDGELAELRFDSPGDPWLLISLSTTLQGQLKALPVLLEAVSSLSVRALLTLGPAVPEQHVRAPDNVIVRGSVPHDLVLPYMAAVLTHGGLSTVMSALSSGVPLVCVAQGREQPLNAGRVQATGVGRALAATASAGEIAEAVQDVMGKPGFRARAAGFAADIASLGQGSVATELVKGLGG